MELNNQIFIFTSTSLILSSVNIIREMAIKLFLQAEA